MCDQENRSLFGAVDVIVKRRVRAEKGIVCELRAKPEAGDKGILLAYAEHLCLGTHIVEKELLILTAEPLQKHTLALGKQHRRLIGLAALADAARLRVDVAVL